jgi:hypothetical protein
MDMNPQQIALAEYIENTYKPGTFSTSWSGYLTTETEVEAVFVEAFNTIYNEDAMRDLTECHLREMV